MGSLRPSASVQWVFCRSCSTCRCISDVFVGRKVISTSYSSTILKLLFTRNVNLDHLVKVVSARFLITNLLSFHFLNHNSKRVMYQNVHCSSIYIARTWKQPKCPSTDEWIKKMWHIYTMEYYSAIKRNEIELFA